MFSESFLARGEPNSQPLEQNRSLKSPLNSFEDWKLLEGVTEWPSPAPDESSASNFDADTVLGPLDDIRRDLETHSPWGAVYLSGVDKRLEEMERTMDRLADQFLIAEGARLPIAKGMTFLTELQEQSSQRRRHQCCKQDTASKDDLTLDGLVFPGIERGSKAVALPGVLQPLQLLDKVTKTALLPPYVQQCWQKLFYSDASCSLLQNSFWYVWLSYFKSKPDPEDLSGLFTLISENFMSLQYSILGQKHKDETFIHLPGCLARAVYSAFCHAFPDSSKVFNSEKFLSHLNNLTYKWITVVGAPLGSWRSWPRHLLDPSFNSVLEDTSSSQQQQEPSPIHKSTTFSEKDVMRLSIRDKSHSVRLSTVATAIGRLRRTRSSHTSGLSRAKTPPTNPDRKEEVSVGQGPTFERVQFGLMGRSPLLQNYLVTHGLEERRKGGEVGRRVGPVIGRTQISKLPPPSMSFQQLLKDSKETSKRNYDHFEKALVKNEQEINATRKKHNALLRASDRRTERLLQHKFKVAIMAEEIMDKYASQSPPIRPAAQTTTGSPPAEH